MAKKIIFLGDSLARIKAFPEVATDITGHELNEVQEGRNPGNWKSMPSIGPGVNEIRVRVEDGAFRTIYIAKFKEAIYVLHAFQKKSQQTSKKDIALAKKRLQKLILERTNHEKGSG
ncbi:MAG: type II toxin-antitoxin system RelE/ParE family toxin [Bacteroidota bacterium]